MYLFHIFRYFYAVAQRLLAVGSLTIANQTMRLLPCDPSVVYVLDIDEEVEEFVEDFLSNKRYGGGDIADFLLDETTRSARVTFRDEKGILLKMLKYLK